MGEEVKKPRKRGEEGRCLKICRIDRSIGGHDAKRARGRFSGRTMGGGEQPNHGDQFDDFEDCRQWPLPILPSQKSVSVLMRVERTREREREKERDGTHMSKANPSETCGTAIISTQLALVLT